VKADHMTKIRSKDGSRIAYWRSGSGPSQVLVHGTTADHTRWDSVAAAFEEKFTVYAIEREFEEVAAVIDSIQGPANLLGHSYGAMCSLEAALLTKNIAESPPFIKKATGLIHEALPNSRIVVMPGQQHAAMNTAPELFTAEVVRFLLE